MALNAVIGGEVHVVFLPPTTAVPQVKAGKLRALGFSEFRQLFHSEIKSYAEFVREEDPAGVTWRHYACSCGEHICKRDE